MTVLPQELRWLKTLRLKKQTGYLAPISSKFPFGEAAIKKRMTTCKELMMPGKTLHMWSDAWITPCWCWTKTRIWRRESIQLIYNRLRTDMTQAAWPSTVLWVAIFDVKIGQGKFRNSLAAAGAPTTPCPSCWTILPSA